MESLPTRHFTVQSLAAHWEVSQSHIYNLIHGREIRYLRIGKAIRIPAQFVLEYEEAACREILTPSVSGSTGTESGMSYGLSAPQPDSESFALNRVASRRQRQIDRLLSNTAHNSSQS